MPILTTRKLRRLESQAARAKRLERGLDRKRLMREIAADLRKKDRATLADLRRKIAVAKERRRVALARARQRCKARRLGLRDEIRRFRERERERINAEVRGMRQAARARCDARKAEIRKLGLKTEQAARERFKAERKYQAEIRQAEAHAKKQRDKFKRSAVEARREDDDQVRHNLPPELVPVFDQVKGQIKGSPFQSRTEAFLKWAEENPDEVITIQGDLADREAKRLIAEQEALARKAKQRRRHGYRMSKAELDRYLAGVPF